MGTAYRVVITEVAKRDIKAICAYIASADGKARALGVVNAIEKLCATLSDLPQRGNVSREMAALGVADIRELHYKPYRIFYQISGNTVEVLSILDGRRDMKTQLQRRLLS